VNSTNEALNAEKKYRTSVEEAQEYIEKFDILETINNVGNDEVFTPVKVCQQMLELLPEEVWSNPDYKWLNPCDKNGVFLREIALRLDAGLSKWEIDTEKRRKHILQKMIYSIGLTKFTSQVSRRTVYYCSHANRKFDGKVDQDGNSINGYAIGNGEWFQSEQGNVLTPITEHSFKKGKCIYCGTAEKNKDGKPGRYSDPKQLEHYAYEFIHVEDIEKHLQKRFFGGDKMKFDIIIGNPPYQLSDGGQGASAGALFYKFINQAKSLKPKYLSMIVPSKWLTREGKGYKYDEFCTEMLFDRRISHLHDFIDYKDIFPMVTSIKGGVCYFLLDRDYNGKCDYSLYDSNHTLISREKRYLGNKHTDVAIRDSRRLTIVDKILIRKETTFDTIVSPRKPYGLSGDIFSVDMSKYNLPPLSDVPIGDGYIIHGLDKGLKRTVKYIPADYPVPSRSNDISKWKIFTNRNVGDGKMGSYQPKNIIGEPNSLCSETYLQIGPFETELETLNCESYFKTKLFRLLVETLKSTQGLNQDTFKLVPLQDFSKSWTDVELYSKYNLSNEEIAYIEENIKDVEW
jgi:site-specific DNA-methyltransferase (adenine-specific)